jgi:hypothetical protein
MHQNHNITPGLQMIFIINYDDKYNCYVGATKYSLKIETEQLFDLFDSEDSLEFKNRVNQGNNTIITIVQK